MVFNSLEKNNIKVLTSFNSQKKLIILFPSAATSFGDYKNFLNSISKTVDVIYVCAGYNGLIVNDDSYIPYTLEEFIQVFEKSFKSVLKNYEKVILLGQSFGACIAYEIYKKMQNVQLILVSAPFSEVSFKYNKIGLLLLGFLTDTSWGRKITNFWEPTFLRLCNKFKLNSSQQLLIKALQRSGIINYLSCIRETLKYGIIDNDNLSKEIIMVFGKQDPFLNNFCHQINLHNRKNSYFLDYGHTILQKDWKFILKFI